MKKLILSFFIILGGLPPSIILCQNRNRIAIQTGLFHLSFDKTPLITNTKTTNKVLIKNPQSYFGGYLNESLGFLYKRNLHKKSSISLEYMSHKTRSEEHTSELQYRPHIVCRLLLEKKKRHQRRLDFQALVRPISGTDFSLWGCSGRSLVRRFLERPPSRPKD